MHPILAALVLVASVSAQERDLNGDPLPAGAVARMGKKGAAPSIYRGGTNGLAFSPDGKFVAVAADDLRIWDAAAGKETLQRKATGRSVSSVAFSPDGKTLAYSDDEQSGVRLLDVATGKEIRKFSADPSNAALGYSTVTALAWTPDGKTMVAVLLDRLIKLLDPETGDERKTISHQGARYLGLTADGKTMVTSGWTDKTARLWDVESGKELGTCAAEGQVAISPDGRKVAITAKDRKPRLWDRDKGDDLAGIPYPGKFVTALAFSPDGKRLVMSGDVIVVWDLAEGKAVDTFDGASSWALAFSPDGKTVAFGKMMAVGLRDIATATTRDLTHLGEPAHQASISSLTFSPDGKTLASASHDTTVRLWDSATGRQRFNLRLHKYWVNHVRFSPDGAVLASACQDDSIALWDAKTGEHLRLLKSSSQWPDRMAFSADGKNLFSIGNYGTFYHWSVEDGKKVATRADIAKRPNRAGYPLQGVGFTPDGRVMVVAEDSGERMAMVMKYRIDFWDVATFKKTHSTIVENFARKTTFSEDGRLMATGCGDRFTVLEVATGQILFATAKEHRSCSRDGGLAFSPDGQILASAGDDTNLVYWNVLTGEVISTVAGNDGQGSALAFSPDGRTLASGNDAGTILTWNTDDVRKKAALSVPSGPEEAWGLLAGDGVQAYRAIVALTGAGDKAVEFLAARLQPPAMNPERIEEHIAALDHDDFNVRKKAAEDLEKFGPAAEAALRQRLAANPSAEMRGQLQRLLEPFKEGAPPSRETMRRRRAIQALERIGTAAARGALAKQAKESPFPKVKEDAEGALRRLGSR